MGWPFRYVSELSLGLPGVLACAPSVTYQACSAHSPQLTDLSVHDDRHIESPSVPEGLICDQLGHEMRDIRACSRPSVEERCHRRLDDIVG